MKHLPDFSFETPLWEKGFTVIGIDEVGRGAFAGPVGVGGVVFSSSLKSSQKENLLSLGINDSKKLTKKKREELSLHIKDLAVAWHISFVSVETINLFGVGKAVFEGMREVCGVLKQKIQKPYVLIDAFTIPDVFLPQKGIVRGDSLNISIAAASIIAKVERDDLMRKLAISYPQYNWDENKGYGTLKHRQAITRQGLTSLHRDVFCRNIVDNLLF